MKIALDYDKTYNLNPDFWDVFIDHCLSEGVDIRIVTARSPIHDRIDDRVHPDLSETIIYCDGVAKRFVCHWFADNGKGWDPDIWIDDKPEGVDNNSKATREVLDVWRQSEEYKM